MSQERESGRRSATGPPVSPNADPHANPGTSDHDRALFDAHGPRMRAELEEFWRRMPGPRRFDGARVMDFGCGTGEMTIDLARRGAAHVLGVELSEERVRYARDRVRDAFPEFAGRIEYTVAPIESLEASSFDFIVTKDTFEHVIGLDALLPLLARLLVPGGQMLAGFSPLWYSMFGDHRLSKHILGERIAIPWFHVLVGERRLLHHANKDLARRGLPPRQNLQEFGFNQLTCHEFKAIFEDSGLEILDFTTNRSSSRLVDRLGRIPVPRVLEKYWVRSIYARLRRPHPA